MAVPQQTAHQLSQQVYHGSLRATDETVNRWPVRNRLESFVPCSS